MTATETVRKAPILDVHGAFLRRTDWSNANLERANLARADLSNANLRGTNLKDANVERTVLIGADLTDAQNLTLSQLAKAIVDETTTLPAPLSLRELTQRRAHAPD